jgi:hypothetical protein
VAIRLEVQFSVGNHASNFDLEDRIKEVEGRRRQNVIVKKVTQSSSLINELILITI